jgi:hypothetical protein
MQGNGSRFFPGTSTWERSRMRGTALWHRGLPSAKGSGAAKAGQRQSSCFQGLSVASCDGVAPAEQERVRMARSGGAREAQQPGRPTAEPRLPSRPRAAPACCREPATPCERRRRLAPPARAFSSGCTRLISCLLLRTPAALARSRSIRRPLLDSSSRVRPCERN